MAAKLLRSRAETGGSRAELVHSRDSCDVDRWTMPLLAKGPIHSRVIGVHDVDPMSPSLDLIVRGLRLRAVNAEACSARADVTHHRSVDELWRYEHVVVARTETIVHILGNAAEQRARELARERTRR